MPRPIKQIAENAGEDGNVVANEVLSKNGQRTTATTPAPASTPTWSKKGIIDPTKVVRSALQNAASVATLLLTCDALVADEPKEGQEEVRPPGGYDDMY